MRRKLNLGFLAIILLLWVICTLTVLNSMSVREVFVNLEADIVPVATKTAEMKYLTTEIRHWTLTYVIRGNVIRSGKTTKEWLHEQWTALEEGARQHLEHVGNIGLGEQRAAEEIVDLSLKLISVSAEIVHLKDRGTGNDELFEKVRKEFGSPLFYPLRKMLDEHAAAHLEELSAVGNRISSKHDANITYTIILGLVTTLLAILVGLLVDRLFVRYVTERNRAEEALREQYEKREELERILNRTPAVVFLWRAAEGWPVEFVSDNVDQFGYKPQDFYSGDVPYADIVHPDDLERVVSEVTQHSSQEIYDSFTQEYRIVTKTGEICWVDDHTWIRRDEDGIITHYQGIIVDITERKRAEEKIRKLNRELEKRVRRRTRQLEAVNSELESFVYSVSHDLRAPLRAMDGFSEALAEDYAEKLEEKAKTYIKRVQRASRKMGQLIDDLLSLSQVSRGDLSFQKFDFSALAESVMSDLLQAQPERQVQVSIEPNLVGHGDLRLLRVVLYNLLDNAWKFTGKVDEVKIEFGRIETERGPAFFVRDNGVGFDMRYVHKLFGAFQRLHAESEFEGTGIGLATVARIVGRHGGQAWGEGKVGRGATFCFTLPETIEDQDGQEGHLIGGRQSGRR